jgi:RimJ/RimL family protein N-acetyltransferase
MASAMAIREATRDDVDELARLRWQMTDEEGDARQSVDEFRPRFAEAFDRFRASGSWTVFVVLGSDGRLVGCLWLKRIERVPRPNRDAPVMGYVTNVYVEPAWRNRGVGTRLLAAARELELIPDL